uniref:Uncharacterized protein n=1 Tax=Fibrocapsa japonica TaxID=94617 RepID=A0A7S2UVQ4_9STRA
MIFSKPSTECTIGATFAPIYTPGRTISHSTIGTSPSQIKCIRKGQTDVQPPVIIPVTIALFVSTPTNEVRVKKVIMAFPIPIFDTRIKPAMKPKKLSLEYVLGLSSICCSFSPEVVQKSAST